MNDKPAKDASCKPYIKKIIRFIKKNHHLFRKAVIFAIAYKKATRTNKHTLFFAGVVKLVDTLDLGSSAARLGGSSPSTRTRMNLTLGSDFFLPKN